MTDDFETKTGIIAVKSGDGIATSRKIVEQYPVKAEEFTDRLDTLFKEYCRTEEEPDDNTKMPPIDVLIMMATYMGFAVGAFLLDEEGGPDIIIPEAARIAGGMMSVIIDNSIAAQRMDKTDDCDCEGCKRRRATTEANDNAQTVH